MPRALWFLMHLQAKALLRRLLRRTRSVRGLVFFVLGVLVLGSQLLFGLGLYLRQTRPPEEFLGWGPVAFFLLTLTALLGSGEGSLAFRPAEVDLLFPAPFTRRQLLIYKLVGRWFGALFSAFFFCIWLMRYRHDAWFVLAGAWLAIYGVQLLPVGLTLCAQRLAAVTTLRRNVLIAVLVLAGTAALLAWRQSLTGDPADYWQQLRASLPARVLLAPFTVFAHVIVARDWGEFCGWAALGLAIDGLLVAGILWLDANYYEAAIHASQRMQKRIEMVRRGGGLIVRGERAAARRLPMLPWLAGAGPIAWRQATTLVRTNWWLFLVIVGIGAAPGLVPLLSKPDRFSSDLLLGIAPLSIGYLTLMLIWTLRCDFRSEMARMDWLKLLPLRPWAIAAGELLVPCALTTALQTFAWAAVCIYAGRPQWIFAVPVVAAPVNVILFGLENAMFLLFPPQTMLGQPMDFQNFGRHLVLGVTKTFAWMIIGLIVGGPAAGVMLLTDSPAAAVLVASALAVTVAVPMVAAVSWAFTRFDITRDLPQM
ncbi:MAG: putative ABC exporter domain-containing protein [Pirellulales bacterium]|nr:putative ABC exporter domain-containing protein [Pirellulales bacterium]